MTIHQSSGHGRNRHGLHACGRLLPARALLCVLVALAAWLAAISSSAAQPAAASGAAQPAATPQPSAAPTPSVPSPRAPTAVAAPASAASGLTPLTLYVGQAHVLQEAGVRRIAVGNGRVVQATALDERQVLLIPEAPGHSTVHLWTRGQPHGYAVEVLPAEVGQALAEVRALIGGAANVTVRPVGDKVVIEGERLTEEQALRLGEIGKRIPQVVNLASRVAFDRMIGIDVRMVEIRRDALENIGIRWNPSAAGPTFGVVGDFHRSAALQPGGAASGGAGGIEIRPRVSPFATALSLATSFTSAINALVQDGSAVVLAEPKLSCRSGGSARFVAGGELPIPYSGALGAAGILFKEFGVKFDVSPVASESGTISAKIATEISAINFEVTVREVPGLTKRRAETEVNLREHETIVIAGLLSEDSARQVDRVAGLGELPVLGNLFRSRQFRERKTELVVLITPYFMSGTVSSDGQGLPPRPPLPNLRGSAAGADGPSAAPAAAGATASVSGAASSPAAPTPVAPATATTAPATPATPVLAGAEPQRRRPPMVE